MRLTLSEAQNLIKAPSSKNLIEKGRVYESSLRLYTEEMYLDELCREEAWTLFLGKMKTKLTPKKYERLNDFIKYPLPVVNIGEGVLTDIYKIFDSMNSYFHVEFLNSTNQSNMEKILDDVSVHNWLVKHGKQALKNSPNSIVLVDKDEKGIPFLVEINSDRLIDLVVKNDSTLEYIIFIHSFIKAADGSTITVVGVYDDYSYKIYHRQEGGEPVFVEEIAHNIGYCPARMILSRRRRKSDWYNRKAPLGPVISKLEEWQQFEIYKYYTDHYAAFPVTELPTADCSVNNCEGGKIYTSVEGSMHRTFHECPECSMRAILGPGTEIQITPKSDKDDVDSSGIFKFITPETEILEYLDKKQDGIESRIYLKTVGEDELLKTEAVNTDQVKGSFESKENILLKWKEAFDVCYKWITETVIRTFNAQAQVVVHANFGTEFYLLSEEGLQARFDAAKKAGLPKGEIDMIYKQIIETKYRNNPEKLTRMHILNLIDPMPYATEAEALVRYQNKLISFEDFVINSNLISFVNRFELENGSIVEFGKKTDFAKKIEAIKETFKTYINVTATNPTE